MRKRESPLIMPRSTAIVYLILDLTKNRFVLALLNVRQQAFLSV